MRQEKETQHPAKINIRVGGMVLDVYCLLRVAFAGLKLSTFKSGGRRSQRLVHAVSCGLGCWACARPFGGQRMQSASPTENLFGGRRCGTVQTGTVHQCSHAALATLMLSSSCHNKVCRARFGGLRATERTSGTCFSGLLWGEQSRPDGPLMPRSCSYCLVMDPKP